MQSIFSFRLYRWNWYDAFVRWVLAGVVQAVASSSMIVIAPTFFPPRAETCSVGAPPGLEALQN